MDRISIFICTDAESLNIFINKLSHPKVQIISLNLIEPGKIVLFYWAEYRTKYEPC